jgi:hypothetical protein
MSSFHQSLPPSLPLLGCTPSHPLTNIYPQNDIPLCKPNDPASPSCPKRNVQAPCATTIPFPLCISRLFTSPPEADKGTTTAVAVTTTYCHAATN